MLFLAGTQFENNDGTKPYGLDPSETILPEYLKQLGYRSHAVGQVSTEGYMIPLPS